MTDDLINNIELPSDKKLCVAIVVGETSGDLLGSGLMAELKKRHPNIEFVGVGGSKMEAQGLSSMFPMERLSVIGITEVFGRIPELLKRRSKLIKDIIAIKPDVFIGIDAPDFNLKIELKLRRAGIKTIHYVSPSVWAWKQKRIFKIKEACDLVLALFPFETKIYKEHNIPVAFVGHPLADSIPLELDKNAIKAELGFSDSTPVVALMPGSRAGEVSRLAPIFLETAVKIVDKYPSVQFVIPCANASRREQLESLLKGYKLPIRLLDGQSQKALGACDVVLIASGTATLEALLCVRPMVVAYKLTTLSFYLIKSLFKMPYVSIPNILAGRFVVPELLQHDATPEKLFNALVPLLDGNIKDQVENFKATHIELKQNASEKAAEAVLKLIATA